MDNTEIEIKNEQNYIDMVNQLKIKYNYFEKQNQDLKDEMNDLKKDIMVIYGLVRTTDNFLNNIILDDNTNQILDFLIESIRGLCSGIIDAHILE
tara:strand:- start:39 stop:323 length:285 start_codon:yes stop_codon:yes gene_type:complete